MVIENLHWGMGLINLFGNQIMPYSEILKSTANNSFISKEFIKLKKYFTQQHNSIFIKEAVYLEPIFTANNFEEFSQGLENKKFSEIRKIEKDLIKTHDSGEYQLQRKCLCCHQTSQMLVDYKYSSTENGISTPNWRERLVCKNCQLNNRQRMIAKLTQQHIEKLNSKNIYFMEQVTPIYQWVTKKYPNLQILGSEYLGYEYKGGETINGIRHEDVMNLSFETASIDLIVSNDVFEHVPNVSEALKECARILRPAGQMIATIPFHATHIKSEVRAKLTANVLEHLLPPQYHGNPISADGCLVFHDFGWDLMDTFIEAGFASAHCEVYGSDEYGHLGHGLIAFRLQK
jgi:SAM-dependent methyltransferase